jgi:hypothetical protein
LIELFVVSFSMDLGTVTCNFNLIKHFVRAETHSRKQTDIFFVALIASSDGRLF